MLKRQRFYVLICFLGEPDPPSGLKKTFSNATIIEMTWNIPYNGNSNITHYELEVYDDVTSNMWQINATSPPAGISDLVLNRDYGIRVRAKNEHVGYGRFSTQKTISTENTAGMKWSSYYNFVDKRGAICI